MVSGLHGTKSVLSPPSNPPFDLTNTGKLKTIKRSAVSIASSMSFSLISYFSASRMSKYHTTRAPESAHQRTVSTFHSTPSSSNSTPSSARSEADGVRGLGALGALRAVGAAGPRARFTRGFAVLTLGALKAQFSLSKGTNSLTFFSPRWGNGTSTPLPDGGYRFLIGCRWFVDIGSVR